MGFSAGSYDIYLEAGKKKVFAVAIDWPGWCRFGKDEDSAVQALVDAASRYALIAGYANVEFDPAEAAAQIKTIARLEGSSTTDFGAPDAQLAEDWAPLEAGELQRSIQLLKACWQAFDQAVDGAEGKVLQTGPRGGGRDLAKIVEHVLGAEEAYLKRLGWTPGSAKGETTEQHRDRLRREVIQGLQAAAGGQLPREGPRGGKRWPPRFFVRRLAWHAVDHAWEIEDRIIL